MYDEEKLYSVIVVHILNFRDLIMRFIHIELIIIIIIVSSARINCMTTRSHGKFRICTTTNSLTLYSFSSLYIFVT